MVFIKRKCWSNFGPLQSTILSSTDDEQECSDLSQLFISLGYPLFLKRNCVQGGGEGFDALSKIRFGLNCLSKHGEDA